MLYLHMEITCSKKKVSQVSLLLTQLLVWNAEPSPFTGWFQTELVEEAPGTNDWERKQFISDISFLC